MPNKILLKRSSEADHAPVESDLEYGELALNYTDEKLYLKNSSNQIIEVGSITYTNAVQEGFLNITATLSDGEDGEEDAVYHDINLTASPYMPADPDTAIVLFQGSVYRNSDGIMSRTASAVATTARLINSGQTLRISGSYEQDTPDTLYFVGWWSIIGG